MKIKKEPWQGTASKKDNGKELTAPCGCVFVATNGFWLRVTDCSKHLEHEKIY